MPNPQHLVVNNPKPPLAGVFLHINAAEGFPDGSRSGILLRAETYLVKLPGEAASAALLQAARTDLPSPPAGADVPAFLKIRVADPTLHSELLARFRETFQVDRVKTDFFLRTVLLSYLEFRQGQVLPETEAVPPGVDRLALNLRLARLLADPSPEAERKLARIAALWEDKKEDF